MRDALVMLIGAYLFILCVNGALWFLGNAFGLDTVSGLSLNFTSLNTNLTNQGKEFGEDGGFNPELIFGDFGKGITQFWQLISGGFLMEFMERLGLDSNFILPMQVTVVGFLGVIAGIYYISGRA